MRSLYARAIYEDPAATLDDLREAAATLVETARTARRVMGGTHPLTAGIEENLRDARAALRSKKRPAPKTFTRSDDETPVPGVEEETNKCFLCGGIGHWARDCPKKKKGGAM